MTELEEIRNALSGAGDAVGFRPSRVQVTWEFVLAVHSFTRWPVDAWAGVRDESGKLSTLHWIQGNTLGTLSADGSDGQPTVTGSVQFLSNIGAVKIAAEVDENDFGPGRARRSITVNFVGGEDITLNVAETSGHLREQANQFIDALLDAVSGHEIRSQQ